MKYIVMEEARKGNSDCFTWEYESREEAISQAEMIWHHLTSGEQKKNTVWVLDSINPDEDAENHFDGFPIWTDGEDEK